MCNYNRYNRYNRYNLTILQYVDYAIELRFQVFKTDPLTSAQAEALDKLPYPFWKQATEGRSAQLVVEPEDINAVEKFFQHNGIQYNVHIKDLKQ